MKTYHFPESSNLMADIRNILSGLRFNSDSFGVPSGLLLSYLSFLLLTCLFTTGISGCNQAPPISYHGQIFIRYANQILEINEIADSPGYETQIIAGKTSFGSISPDKNFLLYSTDSLTVLRNLTNNNKRTILPYPINNVSWSTDSKYFCYKTFKNLPNDKIGPSSRLYIYCVPDQISEAIYTGQTEVYTTFGEVTESVDGMSWLSSKDLLFQCGSTFPYRIESKDVCRDGNALMAENTVIYSLGKPSHGSGCQQRFWSRGVPLDSSFFLFSKSEFAYSPTFYDGISDKYYITDRMIKTTEQSNEKSDCFQGLDIREINCRLYSEVGVIHGTSILYFLKDGEWNNKLLYFINPKNLKKTLKRSIEYFPTEKFSFILDPNEKMIAYFNNYGLNIYDLYSKQKLTLTINNPNDEPIGNSVSSFGELLGWARH